MACAFDHSANPRVILAVRAWRSSQKMLRNTSFEFALDLAELEIRYHTVLDN